MRRIFSSRTNVLQNWLFWAESVSRWRIRYLNKSNTFFSSLLSSGAGWGEKVKIRYISNIAWQSFTGIFSCLWEKAKYEGKSLRNPQVGHDHWKKRCTKILVKKFREAAEIAGEIWGIRAYVCVQLRSKVDKSRLFFWIYDGCHAVETLYSSLAWTLRHKTNISHSSPQNKSWENEMLKYCLLPLYSIQNNLPKIYNLIRKSEFFFGSLITQVYSSVLCWAAHCLLLLYL